jgi:ABC-type branched-subunit amino acid transport system permease subunit
MKKGLVMILLAAVVITGAIIWLMHGHEEIRTGTLVMLSILLLLAAFAVAIAVSKLKSAKEGLQSEAELSQLIKDKASSRAYYVSLYWWLIVMYMTEKTPAATETLIGAGILGMAVLFAGFWLYFNFKGKINE